MKKIKYIFYPLNFLLLILVYYLIRQIQNINLESDPKGLSGIALIIIGVTLLITTVITFLIRYFINRNKAFFLELVLSVFCLSAIFLDNQKLIISEIPEDVKQFVIIYGSEYPNELKWRFKNNLIVYDEFPPTISNRRILQYQNIINRVAKPTSMYLPETTFVSTEGNDLKFTRYRIDTFLKGEYLCFDYYSVNSTLFKQSDLNNRKLVQSIKNEIWK